MATAPTLVPLTSTAEEYRAFGFREWKMTLDGERYRVLNDQGAWELRHFVHNGWAHDWQLIGGGEDVEAWLSRYGITLVD